MSEGFDFRCQEFMAGGKECQRLFGHRGNHRDVGGGGSLLEYRSDSDIEGVDGRPHPQPEPIVVTITADTTKFTQAMRRADRATQGFAFTWRGGWQKLTRILRARRSRV